MTVYVLLAHEGSYSDYICTMLGVFKSREGAQRRIEEVEEYFKERKAWNDLKVAALHEAGLASLGGSPKRITSPANFYKKRQAFVEEWQGQNPKPTPPDEDLEYSSSGEISFDILEETLND